MNIKEEVEDWKRIFAKAALPEPSEEFVRWAVSWSIGPYTCVEILNAWGKCNDTSRT